MGRVLIAVVIIGLGVYAFVQALQAEATQIRFMPRWLWVAVILAFPVVGPLAWIVAGRESQAAITEERRPVGPDDDPDFLRRLK